MSNTEKESQIDELKIEVFLEKFFATLGACHRYSPTSMLVKENTKSLYAMLSELKEDFGKLGFSEFHNNLMLNDKVLSIEFQRTTLAGAFIFFMLEYNFRSITFTEGSSLEDLERFLTLMAIDPEEIRQNPEEILKENSIENITIEPHGISDNEKPAAPSTQAIYFGEEKKENIIPDELPVSPDSQKPSIETKTEMPPSIDKEPSRRKKVKKAIRFEKSRSYETIDATKLPNEPADEAPSNVSTRIMSRPQPKKKSEREKPKTPTGPPSSKANTIDLKVFVRMGEHPVEGAEVTILSNPKVTDIATIKNGARFLLFPGNYKIRITYDVFTITKNIHLENDANNVQVDINLGDPSN